MANVIFKNISKIYENGFEAVQNFNLNIEDGEFIVLVGPSGCGKSTMLRIVAGLESITSGKLYIGDRLVNDLEPKDRSIAMVFQNYALYPHKNVRENLSFGLKINKVKKKIIKSKVEEVSKLLNLEGLLDRKPSMLSGGQRQRVALGRAIIREKEVFLMDEPLSNLDAKLRGELREQIVHLQKRLNKTFIYVTHDQVEAMTMGDKIVIMNDGCIQQIGTPDEVYKNPKNLFVAEFIGSPTINIIPYKKISSMIDNNISLSNIIEKDILIGVRPENLDIIQGLDFEISLIENLGSEKIFYLKGDSLNIRVKTDSTSPFKLYEKCSIRIKNIDIINYFDNNTGNAVDYKFKNI